MNNIITTDSTVAELETLRYRLETQARYIEELQDELKHRTAELQAAVARYKSLERQRGEERMMDALEQSQEYIRAAQQGRENGAVAIAFALIAIAEKLQAANERADRDWFAENERAEREELAASLPDVYWPPETGTFDDEPA